MRDLLAAHGVSIGQVESIVHGTTLATNAVIERRGAVTGLLTTRGFRDALDLARERRYDLFDLRAIYPAPLVPRAAARGDGAPPSRRRDAQALDLAEAERGLDELVHDHRIESLAICLLHAYVNPAHEERLRALARRRFPGLSVSTSADVFPFAGEYERFTTATINAYVQPMVDRYLGRLEAELAREGFRGRLYVMTSAGGTMTLDTARRYPVRLLESGPVAGALMSATLGRQLAAPDVLSFDMGGTTAKGCIILGHEPRKKYEFEVARVHEFSRAADCRCVGRSSTWSRSARGRQHRRGGRARPDPGGAAERRADPGPACYGRGGQQATLTDANVVLGYLDPGSSTVAA